jgi:hypothetical protein
VVCQIRDDLGSHAQRENDAAAGAEKEEMTGHGFRAVARTILDEVLGVRPDYIEHQLARAVRDPNGRAYNRTAHLPERRKMMQQWADYVDKLKTGAFQSAGFMNCARLSGPTRIDLDNGLTTR